MNWRAILAQSRWCILHVHSQEQQKIATFISRHLKLECWYPQETVLRRPCRHARKKTARKLALFKGYLFVKIEDASGLQKLSTADLLHRVLRSHSQIYCFPDREVNKLKNRLEGEIKSPPKHHEYMISGREFAVGDQVEVVNGAFEFHRMTVTDIYMEQTEVLLELFGAQHRAIIPTHHLAAA